MSKPRITDDHLDKNGEKIRRLHLIYVDGESKHLCDCCDEMKQCAHLNDVVNNVSVVCKDCLLEIISTFE